MPCAAIVVGVLAYAWTWLPLPPGLLAPPTVPALTLTDRHGTVLRTTRAEDGSRARWLKLEEMDPDLLASFVAAEDRRFYDHHGVDWLAALRALRDNVTSLHVVSGASTITMQLARMLTGSSRSLVGKSAQTLWALRLEHHLSKQQILEQYLDRVPLGQATLGVESAAQLYFGRSASDLSVGQAALLAGLARLPTADPLSAPDRAAARRREVLVALNDRGYADSATIRRAGLEPVALHDGPPRFLAPHFTSELLARAPAESLGGTWRTTLDLPLQEEVESEVRHTVATLADRGGRQAAAVVLDNRSGAVLAWVGSPDFWADTSGQVDMVVSLRQPGSTLKPFLYGMAFDRGYSPATVLPDLPVTFQTVTGPYRPNNYDQRFHGPVRAREALASSFNIPAVELNERLGYVNLLTTLHQAGFASLDRPADVYGLGLALGNGEVTLLELADAYRSLASGGEWRPVRMRAEGGERELAAGERKVMSPRAASLVLDVLSDPAARVPGFGVETPFDLPFPFAVKTGTSRHYTDNWAVGVAGNFTVAVWVGDFSGRPMDAVSGVSGAGPLLHRVALLAARVVAPGALPSPASYGGELVRICRVSGLRAGDHCPSLEEWVFPDAPPLQPCDWHTASGLRLPVEYAEWAKQVRVDQGVGVDVGVAPDVVAGTAEAPRRAPFRIVSPEDGEHLGVPPGVPRQYASIALQATGGPAAGRAAWYVDGRRVPGERWVIVPGAHTILGVAASGERDSVRVVVE
ncbi:MAG TPA: penicillin-binding protein 1C [Gemmatimonadales bacterium]|nr:penicillin-binding protein 1C [Gemmatimonadales bacterium]